MKTTRVLAILSIITMIPALYMIFLFAPTDATQYTAHLLYSRAAGGRWSIRLGDSVVHWVPRIFDHPRSQMGQVRRLLGRNGSSVHRGTTPYGDDVGKADLGHVVRIRLQRHTSDRSSTDLHFVLHAAFLPAGSREESEALRGVRIVGYGRCTDQLFVDISVSNPTSATRHQSGWRWCRPRYGKNASDVIHRDCSLICICFRPALEDRENRRRSRLPYSGFLSA